MIANTVINFLLILSNILLKIYASVQILTHFEHALHVHAKYFLESE